MKETIAQISLNEGSAFASSPASATDIPANDFGIPTGFFPESGSYARAGWSGGLYTYDAIW